MNISRMRNINSVIFNKKLLASLITLFVSPAYAAGACDYISPVAPVPGVTCSLVDDWRNININNDILKSDNLAPAYHFESYHADNITYKTVINLEDGKTITSDVTGIMALGFPLASYDSHGEPYVNAEQIEINVSGNIYTGRATDIDGSAPQEPIVGPSGSMIFAENNIRETQHSGIYMAGASGMLLGLGVVHQNVDSQIINKSASKDTAAVYIKALESRVTTSGIIRSQVGDAVRLQDTGPVYNYSSGGYVIHDPENIFDVKLQAGSVVEGGAEGAGLKIIGGATSNIIIDAGATLGALSDIAISADGYEHYGYNDYGEFVSRHYTGAETNITNAGSLNGVIQLTSGKDTFINEVTGVWNVREWSDSDRDGIRDTIAPVATSDFGGGTTELINRGQIILAANSDGTPNDALFQNLNTFKNQGRLTLANGVAGDRFIIGGDYIGDQGVIELDTHLGSDDSPSDRVIINGSTSGQTYLSVNNIGGKGAQTVEGIKVIEVQGASLGEFVQQGRIVGGAYEYYLHKNGVNDQNGDWYLRSQLPAIIPPTTDPVPPITDPVPPTTDPVPLTPINRPEPGSYMFNHMATNTLFLLRLHDRSGETQYTDILTGEDKVTSLWLRQTGGHNRASDNSQQLKNQGNRYVTQIGGDIAQWSSDGLDRWHLGLMSGYARQNSNTVSEYSEYTSSGSVEGYSVGLYGTWYANNKDKTGSYIDTWALYNWFDNEVKGEQLATEKYKSRGITTSLEAGYTYKLGERYSNGDKYFLQPKIQLVWMNVRADEHTERNGSRISFEGDGNIQSRVGVRAYINGHNTIDNGKDRQFQPFIETNWIHNTRAFGVTVNNDYNNIDGTKNIAELKVGVEGQLSKNVDLWGNVAQQLGDNGYSDTQAMLSLKYRF
ncbi:autotransporter outer membrane beta-barrel domain-containing protein [Citrobacter meridianamericanus]